MSFTKGELKFLAEAVGKLEGLGFEELYLSTEVVNSGNGRVMGKIDYDESGIFSFIPNRDEV